jgi:hypothetical protein
MRHACAEIRCAKEDRGRGTSAQSTKRQSVLSGTTRARTPLRGRRKWTRITRVGAGQRRDDKSDAIENASLPVEREERKKE